MPALEQAAQRLRQAVSSGSPGEAQRRLAEYCRAISAAQPNMGSLSRALELLHWAGRVVRSQRAHTALELARFSSRRQYCEVAPPPAATLHVEG